METIHDRRMLILTLRDITDQHWSLYNRTENGQLVEELTVATAVRSEAIWGQICFQSGVVGGAP